MKKGRFLHVPVIFRHGKRLSQEPQIRSLVYDESVHVFMTNLLEVLGRDLGTYELGRDLLECFDDDFVLLYNDDFHLQHIDGFYIH